MNVPTKANYISISVKDMKAVIKEIKDLLNKNLIRKSSSSWAYSSFYVEKYYKMFIGNKYLMINYKPMNKAL